MALSFLFQRNSELCTKMAAEAKSVEVREQWIELAKQWQQKADADQLLTGTVSSSEPPPSPNLSPTDLDNPSGHEQPEHMATSAPALVPLETPPLPQNVEKPSQNHAAPAPLQTAGDTGGLDYFWNQLIVDIRTQRPR